MDGRDRRQSRKRHHICCGTLPRVYAVNGGKSQEFLCSAKEDKGFELYLVDFVPQTLTNRDFLSRDHNHVCVAVRFCLPHRENRAGSATVDRTKTTFPLHKPSGCVNAIFRVRRVCFTSKV